MYAEEKDNFDSRRADALAPGERPQFRSCSPKPAHSHGRQGCEDSDFVWASTAAETVDLAWQFQAIAKRACGRERELELEVARQARKLEAARSEATEKSAKIEILQRQLCEKGRELRIREAQLQRSKESEAVLKVAVNNPMDLRQWEDSSKDAMWKEICVLQRKVYAYEARNN